MCDIKVGTVVESGVYVCGEFRAIYKGVVIWTDGDKAKVDVGTIHGCRPWVFLEEMKNLKPTGEKK